MSEAMQGKAHASLFLRLMGYILLSRWVVSRVRHPDLLFVLAQVAAQTGRRDQFIHLIRLTRSSDGTTENNISFPEADYVSPGLTRVKPDAHFPNMIIGDPNTNNWAYLRRGSPHNWYVDSRMPRVGFVNRDEAHILFNTALALTGKPALEVGCFMGWSSCHLALAGVELDIVDPLLLNETAVQSVMESLTAAGIIHLCNFIQDHSPGAVEKLAVEKGRKWNLIFIDGNHSAPSPLEDAKVCERFAAEDCIVLFHDLYSPAVTDGLRYFKDKGWNTRIYNTAQVVGAAWRGAVQPVDHIADPRLGRELPAHLFDLL